MVDFFAGSGAVSRLGKLFGFHVLANDWEEYSWLLNEAFLVTNKNQLDGLFVEHGGIEGVLTLLNSLQEPDEHDCLVSRLYAPAKTENADPDRERMFYTTENARRIDAMRGWIEREYPGEILDEVRTREKRLLLGLLLYEAATHANTSGVFKAYHRGFGGRGKDALSRIMGRVELEMPDLTDGSAEATREDALKLASRLAASQKRISIAYLDPPYNQHQYGSNYHLLNTIARHDRPRVADAPCTAEGKRLDKAGIRRDWTKTRSQFCSRAAAETAFSQLVGTIKADHILVSYSTEGMIPIHRMVEILGQRGRLEIALAEYTRYRGGKQALTTTTSNVEFVLLAHTGETNSASDTRAVLQAIGMSQLATLTKRTVSPAALLDAGYTVAGFARIDRDLVFERQIEGGVRARLTVGNFKHITACQFFVDAQEMQPGELDPERFAAVLAEMTRLTSITREEELEVTMHWARYLLETGDALSLGQPMGEIPLLLKKFNDRKAYQSSLEYLGRVLELADQMTHSAVLSDPRLARKYQRFVRRIESIVSRKLSVDSCDESAVVRHLRECVSFRARRINGRMQSIS
jgi:adenine-specific DNA methylase